MKIVNYILILAIIIIGITFAILNAKPVVLHYYIGNVSMPLSLLLVCSFGIGLIIGLCIMSILMIRLRAQKRAIRKKLRVAEKEIANLRVIPVKDEH